MSTTVDNRVVQMRFDNAQFEAGVAESTKSLENLKESLNLEDSVKGAEEVASKFSVMQIAITTAIATIVHDLTNMGLSLAKSLSIDQVTTGFSKYEQELKSVQVILNSSSDSLETVTEQMRKLAWYTDETSYSYGDMANNISKFTSQGIDTTSAEKAMEGIANMAGLCGASVTDATHAMDGFSKAMAAGKMTQQNWQWIRTAHMDTRQTEQAFIDAAEAVGTLQKTGDGVWKDLKGNEVTLKTFATTMKDGWLSAEAMNKAFTDMGSYSDMLYNFTTKWKELTGDELSCAEAMEKLNNYTEMSKEEMVIYGKAQGLVSESIGTTTISAEELATVEQDLAKWTDSLAKIGFEAGEEYRTFTDAIDATKDAASTQFKEIFSSLFGNVEEAKELWTELGGVLNDLFVGDLYEYKDIFQEFHDSFGGFSLIFENFKAILDSITGIIAPFREALSRLFPKPTAQQIADFVKQLTGFTKSLTLSGDAAKGLTNLLELLGVPLKIVAEGIGLVIKLAGAVIIVVNTMIGRFLSIFSSTEKLEASLKKLFGEENYAKVCEALSAAVANLVKVFKQFVQIIRQVISGVANSEASANILAKLTIVVANLATVISNGLIWALDKLSKIDLSGVIDTLSQLFEGKINVFEAGGNIISGLIKGMMDEIPSLLDIAGKIAKTIIDTIKNLLGIASPSKVMIAIGGFIIAGLVAGIVKYKDQIGPVFESIKTTISTAFNGVGETIAPATTGIKEFFKELDIGKIAITGFAAAFAGAIVSIGFSISSLIGNVSKVAKSLSKLMDSVGSVFTGIGKYYSKLGTAAIIESTGESLKYFALCIGALTLSVIALSKVPAEDLAKVVKQVAILSGIIVGVAVALAAAIAIIQRINAKKEAAQAITNMGATISEAATTTANTIQGGFKGLFGSLSSFGTGLTEAIGKFSKAATIASFGVTIGLIGLAFIEVAAALKIIASIPETDLDKATGILIGFGVFVAALAVLLHGTEKLKLSENIAKFGKAMVSMAAALVLMMVPVLVLKDYELEDLHSGIVFLGVAAGLIIAFTAVANSSKEMSGCISKFGTTMIKMAVALDLMLVPMIILKDFEWTQLAKGGAYIGVVSGIFVAFMALARNTMSQGKLMENFGKTMVKFAVAIDLMMVPMLLLKGADPTEILGGLVYIVTVSAIMAEFMKMAEQSSKMSANIAKFGTCMLLMSTSLVLLSGVFLMMQLMDPGKTLASAVAMGVVVAAIGLSINKINDVGKSGDLVKAAACIAGLEICLLALLPVFMVLDKMTFGSIATSVGALVVTLAAISGALLALTKIANDTKGMTVKQYMTVAESIAILAGVMVLIAGSIALVGQLDLAHVAVAAGAMIVSFIAIAGSLVGIGLVIANTKSLNVKDLLTVSTAITIVSASLLAIAGSLSIVAQYNFSSIASSMLGLIVVLAAITAALMVLQTISGPAIAAAAAIGIVSAALLAAAYGIKVFSEINAEGLKNVISAFGSCAEYAGGIAVMGAAMLAFGAGLTVVGVGVITLATGLLIATPAVIAFTSALQVLSSISESGRENIQATLETLISLIPAFATAIGEGIVNILNKLAEAAPAIITIISTIVTGVITTLSENATTIANTVVNILDTILSKITEWAPKLIAFGQQIVILLCNGVLVLTPLLIATGISIITTLIKGLGEGAVEIVNAAAETILNFLNGLADAIVKYAPEFKEAGKKIIAAVVEAITGSKALGEFTKAGLDAIDGFIKGLGDGIANIGTAAKEVGSTALNAIKNVLGIHSPSTVLREVGHLSDVGLEEGIRNGTVDVENAAKLVGQEAFDSFKEDLGEEKCKELGIEADTGLLDGLLSKLGIAKDAGTSLKDSIISGISSLVPEMGFLGESGVDNLLSYFTGVQTAKITKVYDPTVEGGWRDAIEAVDSYTESANAAAEATSSAGGSAKSTAKSMEELAKEYHFGEDAIKQFATTYGETMLKIKYGTEDTTVQSVEAFKKGLRDLRNDIDYTADDAEQTVKNATKDVENNIKSALTSNDEVMALSEKAIDNLALHLYSLSDYYKEDLQNAELDTETSLKHIQASFNEAFSQIQSSLDSIDWFSAAEDTGDEDDIEKIKENMQSQIDLSSEYIDLQKQISQLDISEALKEKARNTSIDEISFLRMLVNSDQEDLDELSSLYEEALNITDYGMYEVAASAAAGCIDMKNILGDGATDGATEFVNGMSTTLDAAINNGTIDNRVMTIAKNSISKMRETWGIHSPSTVTAEMAQNLILGITNTLDSNSTLMYERGKAIASRLCEGLRMGIFMGRSEVINTVVEMCRAAVEAAEEELDMASPSKVFMRIGKFVDLGMAKGITNYSEDVENAVGVLSQSTVNRVNGTISRITDMVNDGIENPTITPHLDLSEVQAGVSQLNGMFESAKVGVEDIQNGTGSGASYSFVQNNYSPKALSRIDIYRQTKNQFSMMKGVRA